MAEEERQRLPSWRVLALVAIAAVGIAIAALVFVLFTGSPQAEDLTFVDSRYPNVDPANSRQASGPIRRGTVSGLEQAWSVPLSFDAESEGSTALPVVVGGVAYMQDVESSVRAIALGDGEIEWERQYRSAPRRQNGVVVADGSVYGADQEGAFALDQKTGEELWYTRLVEDRFSQVDMAPGYHDGLVYVSTAPAAQSGGEVGVLWALDGKTGRKVWSFDTVPRGLWGNPDINFGGGVAYPPAFDGAGSMYVGVGNPGPIPGTSQYPWGSSRPGPNLYTGSVVKLDAKTGKVQWHYQVTPHAICNWDVGSTLLAKAGGRDLVIAAGLAGIVVALDRRTGKPVWKRAVGRHNGHDDDGLQAMRGDYSRLRTPMTVYPGTLGGVYGSPASDGNLLFVPVVNFATRLFSQTEAVPSGSPSGELVALDIASGEPRWTLAFSSPPVGATTVVNDLVLMTTLDGTAYAFGTGDAQTEWTARLPAGTNAGVTVSGGTVLVPAGNARDGGEAVLAAYRLSG